MVVVVHGVVSGFGGTTGTSGFFDVCIAGGEYSGAFDVWIVMVGVGLVYCGGAGGLVVYVTLAGVVDVVQSLEFLPPLPSSPFPGFPWSPP